MKRPVANAELIASLEHELDVAGHEKGCVICARLAARRKVEWAARRGQEIGAVSAGEATYMLRSIDDPKVLDMLADRWSGHG